MDESPFETTPTYAPAKRKINRRFIYLIIAVLFILIAFVGYKIFGTTNTQTAVLKPTPTEAPTPTDTPSPTPSVSPSPSPTSGPTAKPTQNPVDKTTGLNRSKLSATVQNGSGEIGAAGKGSDFLKNLGYNVSATGNADNFEYTGVTIKVKSASKDFLALLKKDLGASYTVDAATSDLSDSFSTDALVIIGK
jgi:hypothetical protein